MKRRGFTLIESLVVAGILAVGCALLLPALNKARARAVKVQVISNLRTISIAIVTYKNENKGMFPWVGDRYSLPGVADAAWTKGYNGAVVLCQALVGPTDLDDMDTDGVAQLGFRTQPGGRVFGPYLPADTFTIIDLDGGARSQQPSPIAGKTARAPVLCDSFGNPILYFPASLVRNNVRIAPTGPAAAPPYVGSSESSRYDLSDNLGANPKTGPFGRPSDGSTAEAGQRVQVMLGDRNTNGVVDADEQEINEPFLLWSAGSDGVFGPNTPTADAAADCDDATNFQ